MGATGAEMGRSSLLVIVPAYNEGPCIGRVVSELRAWVPEAHVVVINDGSLDDTSAQARRAGATVIDLPYNLGIGGAVQTGYKYAAATGCDVVVRLDGDGQHDPGYLRQLVAPVLAGDADLVVGSRYVQGRAPGAGDYVPSAARRWGIRFFGLLVSAIAGQRVTDTTSGLHACSPKVAALLARDYPSDYPEVEVLAVLGRAGYRIVEVPVRMRRRLAGRSSITPARSLYYAIKVTLTLLWTLLRAGPAPQGGAHRAGGEFEGEVSSP